MDALRLIFCGNFRRLVRFLGVILLVITKTSHAYDGFTLPSYFLEHPKPSYEGYLDQLKTLRVSPDQQLTLPRSFWGNQCFRKGARLVGRIKPQTQVVDEVCQWQLPSGKALAPIGSAHPLAKRLSFERGETIISLAAIPKHRVRRFGALSDGRQRAEMSTTFLTQQAFKDADLSKEHWKFMKATKFMQRGLWPTHSAFQAYDFEFRLPRVFDKEVEPAVGYKTNLESYLDKQMSVIIAQWHGVPDRLSYRFDHQPPWRFNRLTLTGNSPKDFKKGLRRYQRLQKEGARFDQGGPPPLALKIKHGYLALIANHYRYRVHDRQFTRCPKLSLKGAKAAEVGKFYLCNYQTGQLEPYMKGRSDKTPWAFGSTLLWKKKLDPEELTSWQRMRLFIHWPKPVRSNQKWAKGQPPKMGLVRMYGGYGQLLVESEVPLGNNDQSYPYFKFGVYKARKASQLPVTVDFNLSTLRMYAH